MNNKKKIAFLTIALSAALVISACTQPQSSKEESSKVDETSLISLSSNNESSDLPSSSDSSSAQQSSSENSSSQQSSSENSSSQSSSSEETKMYTVTFMVDGVAVEVDEAEEGATATYNGATPTKTSSDPSIVYRFVGWDKDLNQPITADTVFNAVFSESHYANEVMIDDFESYEDTPSMMDEGWTALGYSNATQTWTDQTAAAVSLSTNSEDGKQSLRFSAWENGVGYKFAKIFDAGTYTNSANALQFKLMVPSINTVKVLLHARVTIGGTIQSPSFTYTLKPTSSDFVEYTIPLADDGWALWNEAGKSIKVCADWMGIHEDDLLKYMTRVEFYVQGNDNGSGLPYTAYLDSAKFVTVNNPAFTENENLKVYDRYTATLNDKTTLRLDVNNDGSAVASIIDLETPQSVNGTITRNGRDITFTSSVLTYNGTLTNGGALIKFKSATGAMATLVDDINLVGVQVVDNFEQYASDGKAYYQGNTDKAARSGCRGAYYSEYYAGSGSSDWGGSGWQLMGGDGSQLKLKQDAAGAHSGNNYLCLKHSKSLAMRYMQWGLLDGTSEQNAFRGSKFGFWAKSNGWVKSFKFYMYSQNAPTNANKDQYVKSFQFTEQAAIGEWKHYEIELNPNAVYYGFMVLIEKNYDLSANEAYLYVDDIEVYGANPYASYEAPVPEEPFALTPGLSYNAKINGLIQVFLNVKKDNNVTLSAPGLGLSVNGTYAIQDKDVTISLEGGVTYVVTASDDGVSLNFKSVTGTGSVAQALNNLSFNMLAYGDTAESYTDAGTMYYQGNTNEDIASGARGAYYCDYYTGSGTSPIGGAGWNLMGGSGDQLTLDKENAIEGSQSLKMKKSTAGGMRYIQWDLFKGTARALTGMNKFVVWLKNQATTETALKVYVFTEQQITASNQTTARVEKEITLDASQDWTAYTVELDPNATYYGYGIFLNAASATGWINVDNAMFYGADNDSSLNFYAKKDVTLTGNISAGEASIKFGNAGSASLTCAGLSADNVACTYSMNMNGANQEMTLTINDTVVVGTYAVSMTGNVTFTVTSATGSLAAYIPVGTVFAS